MVPDPFLYAEVAGARHVVVNSLEHARISEVDATLVVHSYEEFGIDEIIASGATRFEAVLRVMVRACRELGVEAAAVPGGFPVELADHLRAARCRGRGRPGDLRRAPARQEPGRACGDPPRAGVGAGRDACGRRRCCARPSRARRRACRRTASS